MRKTTAPSRSNFKIPLRQKRRAAWARIPREQREPWDVWNARMGWLDDQNQNS